MREAGGCGEGSVVTWGGDRGRAPRVASPHAGCAAVGRWLPGSEPGSLLRLWSADGLCTTLSHVRGHSSPHPPRAQPPGNHCLCLVPLVQLSDFHKSPRILESSVTPSIWPPPPPRTVPPSLPLPGGHAAPSGPSSAGSGLYWQVLTGMKTSSH